MQVVQVLAVHKAVWVAVWVAAWAAPAVLVELQAQVKAVVALARWPLHAQAWFVVGQAMQLDKTLCRVRSQATRVDSKLEPRLGLQEPLAHLAKLGRQVTLLHKMLALVQAAHKTVQRAQAALPWHATPKNRTKKPA